MENRDAVVADYFKLRLMLNRTSLKRDQKTDIDFMAKTMGRSIFRLIATLKGVNNPKHIELCQSNEISRWTPAGYAGLNDLEEFSAKFLNKHLQKNFSKEDVDQAVILLKKELQSLGIPAK